MNCKNTNPKEFADFVSDEEKMLDFFLIGKEEFLKSYSYLEEVEYELTKKRIEEMSNDELCKIFKGCILTLKSNMSNDILYDLDMASAWNEEWEEAALSLTEAVSIVKSYFNV